jgi:hypothetical protein
VTWFSNEVKNIGRIFGEGRQFVRWKGKAVSVCLEFLFIPSLLLSCGLVRVIGGSEISGGHKGCSTDSIFRK